MSKQTKCSRCSNASYKVRSKQSLCQMHYRITQMRDTARARNKAVPTVEQLEEMFSQLISDGMLCPICRQNMPLTGIRNGKRHVVSLQHDNDGELRLICMNCNMAHATFPGDEFYNNTPGETAYCPRCLKILPYTDFYKNKCGSCCRKCRKSVNSEMWSRFGKLWSSNRMAKKNASL